MVKYVGNAPVQQIVRRAIGDLEDEAQQAKLAISVDVDPQLLL
jgi:hypothetical protein